MTIFDRREAEIEIAHCIASLREIVGDADDERLLDKVRLGLSTIRREVDNARREIRFSKLNITHQDTNSFTVTNTDTENLIAPSIKIS